MEGHSSNRLVSLIMDGNYQVKELRLAPSLTPEAAQSLIIEAFNDAVYKTDLLIENAISIVKNKALTEIFKAIDQE